MSVRVMSAVWSNGPADSTQRFVLLALADNASDDGGNAYPSIKEIAKKCAMSERTVIRAIEKLIENGYLIRRRRKDTSNLYQIVLSRLVSDKMALTVNDNMTPTVVTQRHRTSDTVSPKPSYNHPINRGGESLAPKPIPSMTANLHPAIDAMHKVTSYWPGEVAHDLIISKLGDAPDVETLRRAYALWMANGNRPGNFDGICDWYRNLKADPNWTPRPQWQRGGNGNGAADVDTLWQKAIKGIDAGRIEDERLRLAVKAVGGSSAIRAANSYTTDKLKQQLYTAYSTTV